MKCPKCDLEFSDKVLPIHYKTHDKKAEESSGPDLSGTLEELRQIAKDNDISYDGLKKAELLEVLEDHFAEAE